MLEVGNIESVRKVYSCPHCGAGKASFEGLQYGASNTSSERSGPYRQPDTQFLRLQILACPHCHKEVIFFGKESILNVLIDFPVDRIYPRESGISLVDKPASCPDDIYSIYYEGSNVLPISTRLAAAAYRVCLEMLLTHLGYDQKNLSQKIDGLLADKQRHIPEQIAKHLHTYRDAGNIAAHSAQDILGNIIIVEKDEAEFCKEIIEMLFEELFLRVERLQGVADGIKDKVKNWKKK